MIKIVLDLTGADRKQEELLPGALQALETYNDLKLVIAGDETVLSPALKQLTADADVISRISLLHAPEVVLNNEDPVDAFFNKPEASMIKGIKLAAADASVSAFASCGSTGALFTASVMTLGRKTKKRPVLLCPAVKMNGRVFAIVDCGASIDCRTEAMVYFAKMGTAFMKSRGIESPKVALLSNGAEKGKGNAFVKEAYELLEKEENINFCGNTEGNEVLFNDVDVVVCEGFAGNVLMKTLEGTSRTVLQNLEEKAVKAGIDEKAIHAVVEEMIGLTDYNAKGGAFLLGLEKPVIKGHGGAVAETVFHILRLAYESSKNDLAGYMKKA